MLEENEVITRLFHSESSKIVAVISKIFGLNNIEIAEDIVSETFLQATETWRQKGIPQNPTAWLYAVAKQKTLSSFRRNRIFNEKVLPQIKTSEPDTSGYIEVDFSGENIKDSQLRMMFAVCNPIIASEAQICLALRILCGFGIEEIAKAFFSNNETINKRLFRAKEKLRSEKIDLEMPPFWEIDKRLDNVLHIIYLLFNEGYYSATQDQFLRKEFCLEALRLAILLTEFPATNRPKTNALIALMCFHASRFKARHSPTDEFILYEHQDEKLWDKELISQGKLFLDLSANGNEISSYHLEAGIAFWHCLKEDTPEKWDNILRHYTLLMQINYSPSVALNYIYALSKVSGKKIALAEAEKLTLPNNHFYFVLLGELYSGVDNLKARECFQNAVRLAKTQTDKQTILNKLNDLTNGKVR